jgi:Tol biopolymer transport system component
MCQTLGIYKMQVDGSNQQLVVRLPLATRINGLALSPDLNHIAWGITAPKNGTPHAGVYIVGYDGNGLHELPFPPGIGALSRPAFSPDGKTLLVTESDNVANQSIAIEDLNGANRKVLIVNGGAGQFSADGTKIVFARDSLWPSIHEILISDRNGQNEKLIATDAFPAFLSLPHFNPNNANQVIYSAFNNSKAVLKLIDITSGAASNAIPSTPSDYAMLATNGKVAIYERPAQGGKGAALFLSSFGSAGAKQITHDDTTYFSYPQLSPDGKILVCFEYRGLPPLHN